MRKEKNEKKKMLGEQSNSRPLACEASTLPFVLIFVSKLKNNVSIRTTFPLIMAKRDDELFPYDKFAHFFSRRTK